MFNIPEKYRIDVDTSPHKIKFKKENKTHYKIKCSYCDKYIIFEHGEARDITSCPHCSVVSPWILKPKTERILFELQEEYLNKLDFEKFNNYALEIKKPPHEQNKQIIRLHEKQMDKETLTKMFFIVKDYSNSLLKKRIKEKGFYLPPEEFEDKVEQVTFLWYSQFTTNPSFKIKDSWAGQLKWKITEALYASSKDEVHDSFDRIVYSSKGEKSQTLDDLAESFNITFLFTPVGADIHDPFEQSIDLVKELRKLFLLIIKSIRSGETRKDYRSSLLALYSLLFFLQNDVKREDYLYGHFGNKVREDGEKIKLILRKYLREVHSS